MIPVRRDNGNTDCPCSSPEYICGLKEFVSQAHGLLFPFSGGRILQMGQDKLFSSLPTFRPLMHQQYVHCMLHHLNISSMMPIPKDYDIQIQILL